MLSVGDSDVITLLDLRCLRYERVRLPEIYRK